MKCFQCDLGGEYMSNTFIGLLALYGIIHQTSCTNTPKQNSVSERKHKHIVETVFFFFIVHPMFQVNFEEK